MKRYFKTFGKINFLIQFEFFLLKYWFYYKSFGYKSLERLNQYFGKNSFEWFTNIYFIQRLE